MQVHDTIRHEQKPCPTCNKPLDASSQVGDDPSQSPCPGDYTVCLYCGSLLIFREDLHLEKPTKKEYEKVKNNTELNHVIASVKNTIRQYQIKRQKDEFGFFMN